MKELFLISSWKWVLNPNESLSPNNEYNEQEIIHKKSHPLTSRKRRKANRVLRTCYWDIRGSLVGPNTASLPPRPSVHVSAPSRVGEGARCTKFSYLSLLLTKMERLGLREWDENPRSTPHQQKPLCCWSLGSWQIRRKTSQCPLESDPWMGHNAGCPQLEQK